VSLCNACASPKWSDLLYDMIW